MSIHILMSDSEVQMIAHDPVTGNNNPTRWLRDPLVKDYWYSTNHLPTEGATTAELSRRCRAVVNSTGGEVVIWDRASQTGRAHRNPGRLIPVHKRVK